MMMDRSDNEEGHHPPKWGAGKLNKIQEMLGQKDNVDTYKRVVSQGFIEMPAGEYGTFWKRLVASPTSSAKFVASVVTFFLRAEKDPEGTAAQLRGAGNDVSLETLILLLTQTLMLIDAFCDVDTGDKAFREAFAAYRCGVAAGARFDFGNSSSEVIRSFEKRARRSCGPAVSIPRLVVNVTMLGHLGVPTSSIRTASPLLVTQHGGGGESKDPRNRMFGKNRTASGLSSPAASPTATLTSGVTSVAGNTRTVWEECEDDYPFDFHKLMLVLTRAARGRRIRPPRSDPTVLHLPSDQSDPLAQNAGRRSASSGDRATLIFDEMVKLLSKLPQQMSQMKGMQEFTKDRVLALMLIMRIFLTHAPTGDVSRLVELQTVLQTFLTWPLPVSGVAADLNRVCQEEIRSPGALLRRRILMEVPNIHPANGPKPGRHVRTGSTEDPTSPPGGILGRRRSSISTGIKDDLSIIRGGEGVLHIFTDSASSIASSYAVALGRPTNHSAAISRSFRSRNGTRASAAALPRATSSTDANLAVPRDAVLDAHTLRCRLLTHIFEADFHLAEDDETRPSDADIRPSMDSIDGANILSAAAAMLMASSFEDPLQLFARDPDDVMRWFERALEISEAALQLPVEDSASFLTFGARVQFGQAPNNLRPFSPPPPPMSPPSSPLAPPFAALLDAVPPAPVSAQDDEPLLTVVKWYRESALRELLVDIAGEARYFPLRRTPLDKVQDRQLSANRGNQFDNQLASRTPMLRSMSMMRSRAEAKASWTSPSKSGRKTRSGELAKSPRNMTPSKLSRARTSGPYKKSPSIRRSITGAAAGVLRRRSFTERPEEKKSVEEEVKFTDEAVLKRYRESASSNGESQSPGSPGARVRRVQESLQREASDGALTVQSSFHDRGLSPSPEDPLDARSERMGSADDDDVEFQSGEASDRGSFGGGTPWGQGLISAPNGLRVRAESVRKTPLARPPSLSNLGGESSSRETETRDMEERTTGPADELNALDIDLQNLVVPPPPPQPKPVGTAGFVSDFRPYLPELEFRFEELDIAQDRNFTFQGRYPVLGGEINYESEISKMERIARRALMTTPPPVGVTKVFFRTDHHRAEHGRQEAVDIVPPTVLKIGVLGTMEVVHRVLLAWTTMLRREPSWAYALRLQLYLLPGGEGRHDLCKYLARRDKWYRRHIYRPFAKRFPVVPQLPRRENILKELASEAGLGACLPMRLARSSLSSFARFAEEGIRTVVWECRAWNWAPGGQRAPLRSLRDQDDGPRAAEEEFDEVERELRQTLAVAEHDVTIPFVASCDFGFLVEAEMFKKEHGLPVETSLAELLLDRDFHDTRVQPDLHVRVLPAEVDGSMDTQEDTLSGYFPMLSLSNLPQSCEPDEVQGTEDRPLDTHPSQPQLGVYARREKNKVTWRCSTPEEADSLLEGLRSPEAMLPTSFAARVEVLSNRSFQPLHVMLDGTVYGPFKCVRLAPKVLHSAPRGDRDGNMAVHIQSFLPA